MKNIYKVRFLILFVIVLCFSLGSVISAQTVPQIQTNSATNIQNTSATLNANVLNPGDYGSTTVYFQWGTNTSYGYQTPSITQNYVGLLNQTVYGLAPNTAFHFRAVAQNTYGTVYGQDTTFVSGQSASNLITVNAGPDLYLASGQTTVLQGYAYNQNGYTLNYSWTCTGGTLSNYNVAQPTYTTPYINNYNNQTSYSCTLTATNIYSNSNSDSMMVYVSYNNNNNNNYNNNYNNYNNCTYHAYKLCLGNSIYWYDSCGTQQDLYSNCYGSQVCQYGQCTAYITNPVLPPVRPYIANNTTACYGNSIHWYDSLGVVSGLYKNCQDTNSCTLDSCTTNKCINAIKCDGTTCAAGSADYNSYCATTSVVNQNCGNGLCEPNLGETTTNCSNDCKLIAATNILSVSFFSKQDPTSSQWQKTAEIGSNSRIYFMLSIENSSITQADNVNVSANIPSDISSLGNLQLNGTAISGDIVSGINIGSIPPTSTKSVTFEGTTQIIYSASTKIANASVNISGNTSTPTKSDSVSINFSPSQLAATVVTDSGENGFWSFLKHWYMWLLAALILVFLFVIVFKRFSSDV